MTLDPDQKQTRFREKAMTDTNYKRSTQSNCYRLPFGKYEKTRRSRLTSFIIFLSLFFNSPHKPHVFLLNFQKKKKKKKKNYESYKNCKLF